MKKVLIIIVLSLLILYCLFIGYNYRSTFVYPFTHILNKKEIKVVENIFNMIYEEKDDSLKTHCITSESYEQLLLYKQCNKLFGNNFKVKKTVFTVDSTIFLHLIIPDTGSQKIGLTLTLKEKSEKLYYKSMWPSYNYKELLYADSIRNKYFNIKYKTEYVDSCKPALRVEDLFGSDNLKNN